MAENKNEPTIFGARRSLVALSLAASALIMAIGAGVIYWQKSQGAAPPSAEDAIGALGRGLESATLIDDSGAPVTWGALAGRPRAVFFGFLHCPQICPVTVWELNDAMDKIGPSASGLKIEFVTVDPERDNPAALKAYFSGFDGRVRGYTGSAAEIDRVAKAFEVIYKKVPTEGDEYTMDHSAMVFLINARNEVVDVVGFGTPAEVLRQRLERLIAGAEG